jgi:hypothetical protein
MHDESFHSLKARNAELLEMVAHMHEATEELRVRGLTIPGQEAHFGNLLLDNRRLQDNSEENAVAGPNKPKKATAVGCSSAVATPVKSGRAMRSWKEKDVPEMSDTDAKMGQYPDELHVILRKITLCHSLDEGGIPDV